MNTAQHQDQVSVPIVLFSFQRPEMTDSALSRLVSETRTSQIVVSIDGLSSSHSDSQRGWRKETIRVAERWAASDPRVKVMAWDIGEGLTEHIIRAGEIVMGRSNSFIFLEEDMVIGSAGLDFLNNNIAIQSRPRLATAFSRQVHTATENGTRLTAFPGLWGVGLNGQVFEAFVRAYIDKRVDRKVIEWAILESLGTSPIRHLMVEYWYRLTTRAVASSWHTDAVLNYANWTLSNLAIAPTSTFVKDIGHEDTRSMHLREKMNRSYKHSFKSFAGSNRQVCTTCEYEDCLKHIWSASKYKLNSSLLSPHRSSHVNEQ